MPLIDCPDCGHNISDSAKHCVNCGRPNNSIDEHIVQEVELTSKNWKLMKAAGVITILLSILLRNTLGEVPTLLLIIVGSIVLLFGGIGAWWYHE